MKVSILIPNYNHGKYLRKSIESALHQTYQDIEIIIVDDGSSDESVDIIKEYAEKDNRIKNYCKTSNEGFPETFKQCYKVSSGEIIFGLASDDYISDSFFLEFAVARFKQYPKIGLVWARTELFYEDGQIFTVLGQSGKDTFENGSEFLESFLKRESFVAGYSAIFRRCCLDQVGGFQYDLGPQTDYFPNHAVPSVFGGSHIPLVMTRSLVFRDNSNYSNKTSEQDRIYRHCEFEKRMRALGIKGIDESLWLSWRNQLIPNITINSSEYAHQYFNEQIKC